MRSSIRCLAANALRSLLAVGAIGCAAQGLAPATDAVVELRETTIGYGGRTVPFPAARDELIDLLGPPSRRVPRIVVWDDLGLAAWESDADPEVLADVTIWFQDQPYPHVPQTCFRGSIRLPSGAVHALSTQQDFRSAGLVPCDEGQWRARMGRQRVLLDYARGVTTVTMSHYGPERPAVSPLPPGALFVADAASYGFPFEGTFREVFTDGRISTVQVETHGFGGAVDKSIFTAGAIGELARRRGYSFFAILSAGPDRDGSGWRYVVGFTNDEDAEVAEQFPGECGPGCQVFVQEADMVRWWPDGGAAVTEGLR